MASPHAPPSNPFDGFDTYSNVAQQPSPMQQPPMQQPPMQQPPMQQPPMQQQPSPNQWAQQQQQQQQMAYQQQQQQPGSPNMMQSTPNPFAAPNPNVAPVSPNANPFGVPQGGMMVQQPQPPGGMVQQPVLANYPQPLQQQLVPMAPSAVVASPWALQPATPTAPAPAAGAQPYDPLGIFGAPTQPPAQQLQQHQQMPGVQQPAYNMAQQQQMQPHQQLQVQTQQQPYYANQQAYQTPTSHQRLSNEAQAFDVAKQNESLLPDESEDEGLAMIDVELDDDSHTDGNHKDDGEFIGDINTPEIPKKKTKGSKGGGGSSGGASWDRNPDIAPPPPPTPGRQHAEYLSKNTSPNHITSPLPKEELVHHAGYVLSRISFRTVLMRKWKQTFWIQYGPTQLLFFRTYADYMDWLNNPYHTVKAREFLVKLRVDFVSDLKKSSVMGYQVTQVRRKPYGKNVMLHFKLERWMDYGPTIAAAFAAREEEMMNSPSTRGRGGDDNTSNDVAALRKIILGCMRNARDAAMVATRGQSGMGEPVAHRGRYDAENQAASRIPTSERSGNLGYHQAFSAESSDRRRRTHDSDQLTEPSEDEADERVKPNAEPAPAPIIDLLG